MDKMTAQNNTHNSDYKRNPARRHRRGGLLLGVVWLYLKLGVDSRENNVYS
jgi:hypothetical protein